MKKRFSNVLTENFSYKLVALFISLILWLTILGRRDFVLTKSIDLEFITAPGTQVAVQTTDHIKVKISGPRASLKKFLENPVSQGLVLDISQKGEGDVTVDIPLSKIEVPLGVRILGVRPNQVKVEVTKIKRQEHDKQKER